MKYVRTGVTKGRACENRKYHPAYKSWQNMIQRCTNPRLPGYKRYGGQGIKVCDRWLNSSAAFLSDMLPTWFEGATIDRIDLDGDYSPDNTRWVTRADNLSHTSRTVAVTLNGRRMSVLQASVGALVSYQTVLRRVRAGWPIEKAVLTPSQNSNHHR